MKGKFILYLGACVLGLWPVQSQGQPAEGEFQLVYLLSLDQREHPAQVQMLQDVWRNYQGQLQVKGVIRLSLEGAANEYLRQLTSAGDLSYELVGLPEDGPSETPGHLYQVLQGKGSYAVLLDSAHRPVTQGRGSQLPHMLAALSPGYIATEVDESTWGKIKVLFE
ncbi:MAG: hypothetical protein GKR89_21200 [Candidatus Latescibacteria bacterium]|nr:hypothetical protein [Candidatus Latescibacterota bacterium]